MVNGTTAMTEEHNSNFQLIAFCASWAALYVGVRFALLPHRSAAFCRRVVSLVHTAAAVLLSLKAVRREPFAHFGQQTNGDEVPHCLILGCNTVHATPCVLQCVFCTALLSGAKLCNKINTVSGQLTPLWGSTAPGAQPVACLLGVRHRLLPACRLRRCQHCPPPLDLLRAGRGVPRAQRR